MSGFWPATLALLPALIGPLPGEQNSLVTTTCWGEMIEIPLSQDAPDEPGQCHQQGCHGRCSRAGEDDAE